MKKVLLSIVLLLVLFSHTQAQPQPISLTYTILEANEGVNTWFNEDYSESWAYEINESSFTVDLNIDDVTTVDLNLGNLTREGISDDEVQTNLALGYWMLSSAFGFHANTSWDAVEEDFLDLDLLEKDFTETDAQYLGGEVETIVIDFKDAYQNTTLVYSKDEGLLLYAKTSVFGFTLDIKISQINGDDTYYSKQVFSPFNFMYGLMAFPILAALKRKQ
ncbi:MAG: hypothetical protein INQ03_02715 [Candidatus Heimdallarchaeota archaeon]|nr:hypothetical protein [Candidatus Heimdallarchaeota archaeon]